MNPPPIIAINLDHREDRWKETVSAFPKMNIERFSAIQTTPGIHGCRESHFAVLRLAKQRGYPWVAIMEDDCQPYPQFQTEYEAILPLLWKHRSSWDIFNSGPIGLTSMQPLDKNLIKISRCICIQFIIIHSEAYDTILENYDPSSSDPSVDNYYSNFRIVTCAPPLTYQRNSKSDVQTGYSIGGSDQFHQAYKKIMMFRK